MSDVSRETTPPAPDVARGVFGSRLPVAEQFASLLCGDGVVRGLIGPRERGRIWDRHLLNCGVLAEAMPQGASVADIGSGAGLPGLVIAIARPDVTVTLIEPLLRRTTFLTEAVADLGLDNVRVVRGRADALHGAEVFEVVTSRAVAPLDRLLAWSMPLVAPTGSLVAMKGSAVDDEIAEAAPMLRKLGCSRPVVERFGAGTLDQPTTVVRVAWADPSRVRLSPAAGAPRTGTGSRKRWRK